MRLGTIEVKKLTHNSALYGRSFSGMTQLVRTKMVCSQFLHLP